MEKSRKEFDSDCFASQGLAHLGFFNYSSAFDSFDQAIKLNPKNADAYHCRGIAYMNLGKIDKAVSDFKTALDLDNKIIDIYTSLGLAHYKIDDYKKSVMYYRKFLKLTDDKNSETAMEVIDKIKEKGYSPYLI